MPDGVPTGVANAFSALIPATVIITAATIFVGLVEQLFKVTTIEVIYNLIQTPMQGLTDSLFGAVLMCFLVPFLWMFGVHGSLILKMAGTISRRPRIFSCFDFANATM